MVSSLQYGARCSCGYCHISDVETHRQEDHMESFFLAETVRTLQSNSFTLPFGPCLCCEAHCQHASSGTIILFTQEMKAVLKITFFVIYDCNHYLQMLFLYILISQGHSQTFFEVGKNAVLQVLEPSSSSFSIFSPLFPQLFFISVFTTLMFYTNLNFGCILLACGSILFSNLKVDL